jgi:hypothetical protein
VCSRVPPFCNALVQDSDATPIDNYGEHRERPKFPVRILFRYRLGPPKANLVDKVLLPVLSDQYGRVLENKEIEVLYQEVHSA